MPTFDVQFTPVSNASTDLDQRGFVGGADVINFNVTTDTPGLSATEVRQQIQASGQIPREGVTHPTSRLSFCRGVNLRKAGPVYFEGSINYRAERRPRTQTNENLLPWEQPPRFSFRSVTSEVPIDEDVNGDAIVNPGTREPVDGITRPIVDFGMTITRNFLSINPLTVAFFANKVNADVFLLFEPGVCKTGDITAEPQSYVLTDNGSSTDVEYYTVTVPVIAREVYGGREPEKAWWHRRRLQGYYEVQGLEGFNLEVVRALDAEGQPVSSPVLLDDEGRRLPGGADPVFVETQRHEAVNFADFGLLA